MAVHRDSGLCTTGADLATLDNIERWIAWHLTHEENLTSIAEAGALLPDNDALPAIDIGEPGIKQRRREIETGFHDGAAVADYVPFYWTAKSPMMHREVNYGAGQHNGGADQLVLLGLPLSSIIELKLEYCFSDGNASQYRTEFTDSIDTAREILELAPLVDKYWKDSVTQADKQRRRQAELLIRGEVPLTAISFIVTCYPSTLSRIKPVVAAAAPNASFTCRPAFFFK